MEQAINESFSTYNPNQSQCLKITKIVIPELWKAILFGDFKHCGSDTHIDAVTIISFSEVSVNASLVNVGDDGHVRHPILGFRTCKISLRLLSISPYFSLSFFLPYTPPTFTPFFKGRNVTNVTHIWTKRCYCYFTAHKIDTASTIPTSWIRKKSRNEGGHSCIFNEFFVVSLWLRGLNSFGFPWISEHNKLPDMTTLQTQWLCNLVEKVTQF